MRSLWSMWSMRPRAVHRTSGVMLSVLASLASSTLALALAACTVSTMPPISATDTATASPPTRATLTCADTLVPMSPLRDQPTTVPFVGDEVELLCLVTGAPNTDTSFTLTFVITSPQSPPSTPTSSPCVGTLHQGQGACAQTYLLPLPLTVTPNGTTSQPFTSFVYGVLHPSGQRLGPVIPIFATFG